MRVSPEPGERRVIVGDTHGDHAALRRLLERAGAVEADGTRVPGAWLCHVGDVIHAGHGVQADDARCLELALDLFDCLLLGNHELPFAHGIGAFAGMNERLECQPLLDASVRDGRWAVAASVDGFLVTHAGLHPRLARRLLPDAGDDADAVAGALRTAFAARLAGGGASPLFDGVGPARGGRDEHGGIFWCDWGELMKADARTRSPVAQIVGHTPRPRVQRTADGRFWCVDVGAGRSGRLGAIVREPGEDDWRPVEVSRRASP